MSTVLPPEDEVVLQHYRQHGSGQPAAELDARILNAAREAVPARRPSWWSRLGHWLNAASLTQRGSLAFGGLASVVLVLGLVWQGLPSRSDMMEQNAMAPAAIIDAPAVQVERPLQPQPARPAPAVPSVAAMPAPREHVRHMAAVQGKADAQASARMADAESPMLDLDDALRDVLQLRKAGRAEQAEQRLKALRERYSEALLLERLAKLEQQKEHALQP